MESRMEIAEQARNLGVANNPPFPGGPPPGFPTAGQPQPAGQMSWMREPVEPEYQPPLYVYPNGTYASAPQVVPTATHVIGKRHALNPKDLHTIRKRNAPPPLYMFIKPFPTANVEPPASQNRQKRDTRPSSFVNLRRPRLH